MSVKHILVIIIDVIFILLGGMNIVEIFDILVYKEAYPFGAEFFSPYSIYKSEEIYLTFKFLFTVLIMIMIACSFFGFVRSFWVFAFCNVCLALYVVFTV